MPIRIYRNTRDIIITVAITLRRKSLTIRPHASTGHKLLETEVNTVGSPNKGLGFEMLEPCAGKLARTVLKGESGREPRDLPGR